MFLCTNGIFVSVAKEDEHNAASFLSPLIARNNRGLFLIEN